MRLADYLTALDGVLENLGYQKHSENFSWEALPQSIRDKSYIVKVMQTRNKDLAGGVTRSGDLQVILLYKVGVKADESVRYREVIEALEIVEDKILALADAVYSNIKSQVDFLKDYLVGVITFTITYSKEV